MKDGGSAVFVVAMIFVCTLFPDFIGMILVGIYYGLGKDQECSINAKAYLLAYIIIKIFLILCRLLSICFGCIFRDVIGAVI